MNNIPKMEQIKNTIRINPHRPASRRLVSLVSSLRVHRTSFRRRRHPHLARLAMLASLVDSAIQADTVRIAIGLFGSDLAGTRSLGGLDALGCGLDDLIGSSVFERRRHCDFRRVLFAEGAGALAFGSHGWRMCAGVSVKSEVFVGASGGLAWGSRSLRLADFLRTWRKGGDDDEGGNGVEGSTENSWPGKREKVLPAQRNWETQESVKDAHATRGSDDNMAQAE